MDEEDFHEERNEGTRDASSPNSGDDRDDLARRRAARNRSSDTRREDARGLTLRERQERWPIG